MKEIVIPKERAVFWMDGNGVWHNEHGRFQHKKIIDHFNAAIRKDNDGFYVTQINGDILEKVYFPYEDTALFVTDIVKSEPLIVVLNTGEKREIQSGQLWVKNDHLYMGPKNEPIKFSERSLLKLSQWIDYKDGRYFITIGGDKREIPIKGGHS